MQLSRSTILNLLLMAYAGTIPLNKDFLSYATSIILLNQHDSFAEAIKIIHSYKSATAVTICIKNQEQ